MLRIYNTLSGRLEEFRPMVEGEVRFYYCGPTVWDYGHIGNFRSVIATDILRRYLKFKDYRVTHAMNITDVDDRIIAKSQEAGLSLDEYTAKYVDAFWEDFEALGCERPEVVSHATRHIPEMVSLIEKLEQRGHAYRSDRSIYYRIKSFPEYGKLSKINLAGNVAGASERVDTDKYEKEDARDFALWKAPSRPEEPAWDASIGRGRPGWHIECSAMAEAAFGPVFEIHGGGLDLVFPHHENELAQSRALGHEFARIWTHNGMLAFGGEKMSKSLGNDVSLRNVLDTWGREVVLLFYMTGHWRKPIDFSDETLQQAKAQWEGFQGAYRVASAKPEPGEWQRLVRALDDDFNTPEALAILHDWRSRGYWNLLDEGLRLFGLALPPHAGGEDADALRRERDEARAARDWARADELRDRIRALGFDVVDEPGGSRIVPL